MQTEFFSTAEGFELKKTSTTSCCVVFQSKVAQESVAGPSCSFSGVSFYLTRSRKKTPEITSKESCDKGGKNKGRRKTGKEPAAAAVGSSLFYHDSHVGHSLPAFTPRREAGFQLRVQNLTNTLVSPLDFFQMYFTPGLVDDIVPHTNAYAYIEVAKQNSNKRCYTGSDGSWRDTTPD